MTTPTCDVAKVLLRIVLQSGIMKQHLERAMMMHIEAAACAITKNAIGGAGGGVGWWGGGGCMMLHIQSIVLL
jgi:hypothetical protein